MLSVTLLGEHTWVLTPGHWHPASPRLPCDCLPSIHLYLHPYIVINHNCILLLSWLLSHAYPLLPVDPWAWGWDLLTRKRLLAYWFCWNVKLTEHEELPLSQTPTWRSATILPPSPESTSKREGLWPFLTLCYFCLSCFEADTIISISKMRKGGLRAGKQPTLNFKVSWQQSQASPNLICSFVFSTTN